MNLVTYSLMYIIYICVSHISIIKLTLLEFNKHFLKLFILYLQYTALNVHNNVLEFYFH